MSQFFSTDEIAESDRVAALEKLIHEFDALKHKGNDELVHKRRQILLSIWGDLVLARKDPSQQDELKTLSVEPPIVDEINPTSDEIAQDVHDEAMDQVIDARHTDIIQDAETVTAEFNLEDHHKDELLLNEGQGDEKITDALGGESLAIEEQVLPEVSDELQLESETETRTMNHQISIDETTKESLVNKIAGTDVIDNHVSHEIHESEEKTKADVIIQKINNDNDSTKAMTIVDAPSTQPNQIPAFQIMELDKSDDQSLLQIKDVGEVSETAGSKPLLSTDERNTAAKSSSSLIRLKLLKTGVLNDIVLPQGTIVSTIAADAEDLIASGTAEKLLIQNDPEDDI